MKRVVFAGFLLFGMMGLPGCSLELASAIEEENAKLESDIKVLESKLSEIKVLRQEVEEFKKQCAVAEAKKAALIHAHPEVLKQFPALGER